MFYFIYKTVIFATILTFLMLLPMQASSEEQTGYWMCYQTGHIEKKVKVAISPIFIASSGHDEKSLLFEKVTKDQLQDAFVPDFSARCEDYQSQEKANDFLKTKLRMLKKEGVELIWIKFPK